MKLWVRLSLLMGLVCLVPLTLSTYRSVQISVSHVEANARRVLERDAHRLVTVLDTWVELQGSGLRGWMQLYPDLELKTEEQQRSLLRAVFVANPNVVHLALVDEDAVSVVDPVYLSTEQTEGTLAGRATSDEQELRSLIAHLPISELRERRKRLRSNNPRWDDTEVFEPLYVVGSSYRGHGGSLIVPVAVSGLTGDLIMAAGINMGRVLDRLTAAERTRQRELGIFSESSNLIYGSLGPLLNLELIKPLMGTRCGFEDVSNGLYGGIAFERQTGWSVVLVESASMSKTTTDRIRRQNMGVALVMSLLALVFGFILARTVTGPIRELRDVALAMARGEWGHRVRVETSDEVGELGAAFNYMSDQLERNRETLQQQKDEIEAFNQVLQERVDQQTLALREAQAQLVQSGQLAAVAELGAGLAHELNNPLMSVIGLLQVFAAKYPDESMLTHANQEALRCREVVQGMLKLNVVNLDETSGSVVDLRDILRDVSALVQGPFSQRGVSLQIEESVVPLPVAVDPAFASRLFVQVLSAMRAGLTRGARLTVSASCTDQDVVICFEPSVLLAAGGARDDWMAAGVGMWSARRSIDSVGATLRAPEPPERAWRLHWSLAK